MDNLNMPTYRAKEKNSNKYIEGNFVFIPKDQIFALKKDSETFRDRYYIVYELHTDIVEPGYDDSGCEKYHFVAEEVDPSTLSISYPHWKDKDNNSIFASTSKNGKGGDIVKYKDYEQEYTVVFAKDMEQTLVLNLEDEYDTGLKINPRLTILGIKE